MAIDVLITPLSGTIYISGSEAQTPTPPNLTNGSNYLWASGSNLHWGSNEVYTNAPGTSEITGGGAADQVAYYSAASNITGSANLTFDGNTLDVVGSITAGDNSRMTINDNKILVNGDDMYVSGSNDLYLDVSGNNIYLHSNGTKWGAMNNNGNYWDFSANEGSSYLRFIPWNGGAGTTAYTYWGDGTHNQAIYIRGTDSIGTNSTTLTNTYLYQYDGAGNLDTLIQAGGTSYFVNTVSIGTSSPTAGSILSIAGTMDVSSNIDVGNRVRYKGGTTKFLDFTNNSATTLTMAGFTAFRPGYSGNAAGNGQDLGMSDYPWDKVYSQGLTLDNQTGGDTSPGTKTIWVSGSDVYWGTSKLNAQGGGGGTIGGSVSQYAIPYATSADTLGDSGLTSDGTDVTFTSATAQKPKFTIENTNDDSYGGEIRFVKNGTSPADNDFIGEIKWYSDDTDGTQIQYAKYNVRAADVSADSPNASHNWSGIDGSGNLVQYMSLINSQLQIKNSSGDLSGIMYPYKTDGFGIKSIGSKMQINPGNAVNSGELHIDAATVGINTTSPSAYLHISGATEQLRLGYDSTNYTSFTVAADGDLGITNNNVGIGTASPSKKLHVNGTALIAGEFFSEGGGDITGGSWRWRDDALLAFGTNRDIAFIWNDTNQLLYLVSGNSGSNDKLWSVDVSGNTTISGNVGIKTTAPTNRALQFKGDSNYFSMLAADGSEGVQLGTASDGKGILYLNNAGGTTGVYLDSNANSYIRYGDVGIGTTSPDRKLHLSSAGTTFMKFTSDDSQDWSIGANSTAGFTVYDETDAKYRLSIDGDDNITIASGSTLWFNDAGTAPGTLRLRALDGNTMVSGATDLHLVASDDISLKTGGGSGIITMSPDSAELIRLHGSNAMIGTPTALETSKLTIVDTSNPQLALSYDGSNYTTFAQGAADFTISNVGHGDDIIIDSDDKIQLHGVGINYATTADTPYLYIQPTGTDGDAGANIFNLIAGQNITLDAKADTVFKADGTEVMRVSDDDRVGIGTTLPTEKLDVQGNIFTSGGTRGMLIKPTNSVPGNDTFSSIFGSAGLMLGTTGDSYVDVWNTGGRYTRFRHATGSTTDGAMTYVTGSVADTEFFRIQQTGDNYDKDANLYAPHHVTLAAGEDVKLDANEGMTFWYDTEFNIYNDQGTAAMVTFRSGTQAAMEFEADSDIQFKNNTTKLVKIASDGKVGIGTANPSQKLHVAGDFSLGSSVTLIENADISTISGTAFQYGTVESTYVYDATNSLVEAAVITTEANYFVVAPRPVVSVGTPTTISTILPDGSAEVGMKITISQRTSADPQAALSVTAQGSDVIYEGGSNSASAAVTIPSYRGANKTFLTIAAGVWIVID